MTMNRTNSTARARTMVRRGLAMTSRPPPFKPRTLYLEEPLLEFRHGQRLVYPRDGLFLYGPVGETKQLPAIRYGVIGTPDGVRRFRAWSKTMADRKSTRLNSSH